MCSRYYLLNRRQAAVSELADKFEASGNIVGRGKAAKLPFLYSVDKCLEKARISDKIKKYVPIRLIVADERRA